LSTSPGFFNQNKHFDYNNKTMKKQEIYEQTQELFKRYIDFYGVEMV